MFKSNNKVNFNPEDEDDMYSGFNTKLGIDAQSLFENENIQQALRQTSYGRKGAVSCIISSDIIILIGLEF